jgi:ABC-2 type transport system permease protein
MNRNLFVKEMKRNAISFLLWMFAITLLISGTMMVYPTFFENQSKVLGMMSLVPKGALQFKGVSNFSDMLSVLGFYSVNNIIYMMVLGSIFAIVLSSNILAVLFIQIFLLNLVTTMAGFISVEVVKNGPFSIRAFFILSLYTLLLNLLFGAIGLFMSTMVKKPKPITTFSIGLVLFFYFIHTLSKITDSIANIGYLSPFKFVNMEAFNPDYRLSFWHMVYFIGISLLLTGMSYRLYCRKDIYT